MITKMEALYKLSAANLRALAASLRDGPLSLGMTRHAIQQLAGPESDTVFNCLDHFIKDGFAPRHIALLVEAIADTLDKSPDPAVLFEIVFSGPDVPGVPTEDTAAAFQTLVQEAKQEILLVGYAVYGGERIFEPLVVRLRENPGLKVTFCLDISRKVGDTSLNSEIVRRFCHDFRHKNWPWPELPELYYDPRALAESFEQKATLHAKCVVVDRKAALITSANFTEAAQKRNIELGVLVRHPPIAERIAVYFQGLQASGILVRCPLD
jgi:phosphatidylserine/phosphatidylglycerophosphate/cardiolipin synthase-like enzyme